MLRLAVQRAIRPQRLPLKLTPRLFTMPLVTISTNITEALKKHDVVPDVVDEFSPKGLITITYGKDTEVTLGNALKVAETQERPSVAIAFTDKDESATSYTLVMTDPDAPTRGDKTWSEYAHYVVTDIKPEDSADYTLVDFGKANEVLPYLGPGPPVATGKHRYVFILYKETPSHPPKIFESENRANWGTGVPGSGARDWAAKNKLTPVAINFFYAQNVNQTKE